MGRERETFLLLQVRGPKVKGRAFSSNRSTRSFMYESMNGLFPNGGRKTPLMEISLSTGLHGKRRDKTLSSKLQACDATEIGSHLHLSSSSSLRKPSTKASFCQLPTLSLSRSSLFFVNKIYNENLSSKPTFYGVR